MPRIILMSKGTLLAILFSLTGLSCSPDSSEKPNRGNGLTPPHQELYTAAERQDIIAAARAIIEDDPTAALVSIDSLDRPRIRSVDTSKPDSSMTIWIATRPDTRKVDQIRGNPNVALYYNDDLQISYVSIMGTALLHDDIETIEANNPFSDEWTSRFFPDYPKNMLLIEIRPTWMEVMGQGIAASEDTWRPQAVTF
ncbi:MAG: pyridoxamine 5'-phosphate oxidase family protein [Gracilimonas sp.]|nr:pyridoxamine 5'-phosphate oxidase family protein [Gracilimonas sp.]